MGKTKSRFSKVTDHLLVCAEIFEYMEKYNLLEKYADSFASFFECCLCIVCANANNVSESLKMANEIWIKIDIATDNPIICALKNKDYVYVKKWISYSSLEKIFSIKKRYGKKTITVCGIQF
jgi:thermostable 8-oxoguanine DNA glycosylase